MTTRRSFLTLLSGAAAAWPLAARAQQPAMPVIGWLDSNEQPNSDFVAAFRQALSELGYVEGRNVSVAIRGAETYDHLPARAAELVKSRVAVIFAVGSPNAVRAAKAATDTIPIVFANGSDPVKQGLVASLGRPGGNATGVSFFGSTLMTKRLELLHELTPSAAIIGIIMNPLNEQSEPDTADAEAAARNLGQSVVVVRANTAAEINSAFAALTEQRIGGLLLSGDAFFARQRAHITALASRHRLPSIYPARQYVLAGGLASYGDNRLASIRQAGLYVGRVLKGEKPADLPVLQPTKFEFVINLKTAKALGITFPPSFHLRADEVIE